MTLSGHIRAAKTTPRGYYRFLGHIHHAAMRQFNGVECKNTGDQVESCTALVEHKDGVFQILHWREKQSVLAEETRAHTDNTTLGERTPKTA